MKHVYSTALALLTAGAAYGAPTVTGQTISWPADGWYQVQKADNYQQVCAGGRSCDVAPGTYNVINHSTGQRFPHIVVTANSSTAPETSTVVVTGNVISWPDDGWYQVQNVENNQQMCGGGRSCTVPPGTYRVINHTTGQRFTHIVVTDSAPIDPPTANPIVVTGNVISWPDDGWYQVQASDTYAQVCAGGRSCTVASGQYIVINHTTGKRYTSIVVEGSSRISVPTQVNAAGGLNDISVSWNAVSTATSYNIYVSDQPNVVIGAAGVTQYTAQALSLTLTDVVAGTPYYIAVSAEANGQESDLSEEISAQLQAPTMVTLPSGTFTMGCVAGRDDVYESCYASELPAHAVAIQSFKLSATEVTFGQWNACVEEGGCNAYEPDVSTPVCLEANGCEFFEPEVEDWGQENRPVINVSWNDAQAYTTWLTQTTGMSYRLPSEAEWEYAARGGDNTTAYAWGNDIGVNNANCYNTYCEDSFQATSPVASFAPNGFGLYDMHGNVREWVEDCWHINYTNAPATGIVWEGNADCSAVVSRDGSWSYYDGDLRSAARGNYVQTTRTHLQGFRVAADL